MSLKNSGNNNTINTGKNVIVAGDVNGHFNTIKIGDSARESNIRIFVNGNNNSIKIDNPGFIKGLTIHVGNHIPANEVELNIHRNVSIEPGGSILMYNSGNKLKIDKNCMISKNLQIRCGESPHLIFDLESGDYLDNSEGVFIGEHVWIGEDVYITKRVTIPEECIIAARSVVTKRFTGSNLAIAGNPAKVVKENIQWIRNHTQLPSGSKFEKSFLENKKKFE